MKAVVTGGGTGGHIFPALAVAAALRAEDADCEVRYIGGIQGLEAQILPGTGIPFHLVTSKKLRKTLSFSTIGVLLALARGYREAASYLKAFAPDVVISTGGYTAAGTAIAAARQKIPAIIQEYNAVPGRTNLKLAKWATKICVWFEETAHAFPGKAVARTGVPLREGIVSNKSPESAKEAFGLNPELFTILVLGGSQGAKRLNELTLEMMHRVDKPIQVLHQTGERNLNDAIAAAPQLDLRTVRYHPKGFFNSDEIPLAYKAADLLVCRCGISTLAEACVNGIPMFMVPLSTAYADHQTANARVIQQHGGGAYFDEAIMAVTEIADCLAGMISERAEQLHSYGCAARKLGKPNAAKDVAKLAIELASGAR